jgi:alkylated DNA repair protein (DNA oxidative demethylase)
MTLDLFDDEPAAPQPPEWLEPGAVVLRGFALAQAAQLLQAVEAVAARAPFRHLVTPGGKRMSVAMTNCGPLGWISDRSGYRYGPTDPLTGERWPPMPAAFHALAREAAGAAGYPGFAPDACLINRYSPGTRLSLHQDRDEGNYDHPIVSVSLGIPAVFLWGGAQRTDKARRVGLLHGDVVVWGGSARLRFHGVLPLAEAAHALTGAQRINLTFRRARQEPGPVSSAGGAA